MTDILKEYTELRIKYHKLLDIVKEIDYYIGDIALTEEDEVTKGLFAELKKVLKEIQR